MSTSTKEVGQGYIRAQQEVKKLQETLDTERVRKMIEDSKEPDTSTPEATPSEKGKARKIDNSEDPNADDPDDDGKQIDDGRSVELPSGTLICFHRRYSGVGRHSP